MAANHIERTRSTGRRPTALVACASIATIVAAATSHLFPFPAMSATVVLATAALVVLHASPGAGITTGLGVAATAAAATAFLGGEPLDVLGAAAQIAATTALSAFVIRHVRAPADQPAPTSRDARRPVEPAILDLARATLGQMDVTAMESAMEALLVALDCEALSVWRNADGPGSFTAEVLYWAGRRPEGPAEIQWSRTPSAASRFSTGRSHTFADVNDLPNPDRAGYRRVGFSAAIEYPVAVHGAWVGHVSMACNTGTRTWEQHELDAVSTVADIVASIWERETTVERMEQVVAQRDRSLVIQRAISESARLIFESDDGALSRVLRVVLRTLGGDLAYLMNVRIHDAHGPGLEPVACSLSPGVQIPTHLDDGSWVTLPTPYAPVMGGEPVIIADCADLSPTDQEWYSTSMPATVAEMILPIVSNGKVVGMIGLAASSPRTWDAAEMRTLSTIASMIGVARTRADARRGLEDIAKAKDSFIASVSHELRTPMAVVMGLSSELDERRSNFSDDEVAEFIDLIARESREVSQIIEDLLIAARASADSITVLPELIRLDEVVTEAIDSMSPESSYRIASLDLAEVSTLADPLRVRQIVRNLVANGHRHGGSRIFVRVTEHQGMAVLDVSDDGLGIPAERRDAIFEAYEVGETSGRTASIGLGLTVSRRLARLMGGEVTYRDDPMPTFRLTLPVGSVRTVLSELRAVAT